MPAKRPLRSMTSTAVVSAESLQKTLETYTKGAPDPTSPFLSPTLPPSSIEHIPNRTRGHRRQAARR